MNQLPPSYRSGLIAGVVVLVLAGGAVGFGLGRLGHPSSAPASLSAAEPGRKVLYWYDPMVPAQHFDKPGKSPFMDMQLVPRYADQGQASATVSIDPAQQQSLGMRLAAVERDALAQSLDAPGVLEFNQRDVAVIQGRATGFVQRVYGRAPGDVVRAGAPIADLLVPSWGGAEAEYLAVRKTGDAALEAAARQRLRLLGLSDEVIDAVARSGQPRTVITITTPVGGAIQSLDVRQGMTVAMGQTLAQVSGLGSVWLTAAVPEAQAGSIRVGMAARADLSAFPGETFTGKVAAVLPSTQADSHTLQVRVDLPNRSGRLKPGMYGTVHLEGPANSALFVPSEAVIRTGKRALVMLAEQAGQFQPVEVQIGREDNGRTEILAGLTEGQKVVASGQFLIDSEASLSNLAVRPLTAAAPAAPAAPAGQQATLYRTRGRIEALSDNQITFSHEPVPAIGWPAMTMTFTLEGPNLAKGLKVGDRVGFSFEQKPEGPVVRDITRGSGQ